MTLKKVKLLVYFDYHWIIKMHVYTLVKLKSNRIGLLIVELSPLDNSINSRVQACMYGMGLDYALNCVRRASYPAPCKPTPLNPCWFYWCLKDIDVHIYSIKCESPSGSNLLIYKCGKNVWKRLKYKIIMHARNVRRKLLYLFQYVRRWTKILYVLILGKIIIINNNYYNNNI